MTPETKALLIKAINSIKEDTTTITDSQSLHYATGFNDGLEEAERIINQYN